MSEQNKAREDDLPAIPPGCTMSRRLFLQGIGASAAVLAAGAVPALASSLCAIN